MKYPQIIRFTDDINGANAFMQENAQKQPGVIESQTVNIPGRSGHLVPTHAVTIQFIEGEDDVMEENPSEAAPGVPVESPTVLPVEPKKEEPVKPAK